MNNKNLDKIITIIIYFLTIFLICLILYNMFLLINKNPYSHESHKNSIEVTPKSEANPNSIDEVYEIFNITTFF